jgi:hypothetical protein
MEEKIKSLINSIPIELQSTIWIVPSACYNAEGRTKKQVQRERIIKKKQLKQAIEEACLVDGLQTESPYTSMAIMAEELLGGERKRQYFISTWGHFWLVFFSPPRSSPLFFHEVIPEKHSVPLFIDIDVNFVIDPSISNEERDALHRLWTTDLDKKVEKLVEFLEDCLEKKLGVSKCYTVFLPAHRLFCPNGKYSTHVITHMNGGQTRFKTSKDLEYFWYDLLASQDESIRAITHYNEADYKFPYGGAAEAKWQPLRDHNVHRKNGELRLPFCSKRDEPTRALVPVITKGIDDEGLHRIYPHTTSTEERLFLASLLTYIPKLVTVTEFLVHERSQSSLKRPNSIDPGAVTTAAVNGNSDAQADVQFFDHLADEIQKSIPSEGQGPLTTFSIMAPGIITFTSKSTYCTIKKQFHKRNHVFWVVQVKYCVFYQRCFDEECINKMEQTEGPGCLSRSGTPSTKGFKKDFRLALAAEATQYLQRHAAEFEAMKERDPKRQRSDIRFYGTGTRGTLQHEAVKDVLESMTLSVDNIMEMFFEDIDDLLK